MLRTKALALCAAAAAALTVSTAANAAVSSKLTNLKQSSLPGAVQPGGVTPNAATVGDQYTVFTGLANASGLVLIENAATSTATDDTVSFDGLVETINPYATTVPTVRTVTESTVDNGNGTSTLKIHVNGSDDLWPAGFTDSTGAALTGGGFAIGLNLPDQIDSGVVGPALTFTPETISNVKIVFNNDPTDFTTLPNNFFSVSGNQATFGVSFGSAVGLGITDLELQVTYAVPEPATASILGIGALAVLGRRRRIV